MASQIIKSNVSNASQVGQSLAFERGRHDADLSVCAEHGMAKVMFRPKLSDDQATVEIVRVFEIGEQTVAEMFVWSGSYGSNLEARPRYHWLLGNPETCAKLGGQAMLFGPDEVTSAIEVGVLAARVRLEEQQARDLQEANEKRLRAERDAANARKISSYLEDRGGRFGINMRRGNSTKPFWIILFREKWERERFRDWFGWQSHHFAAWAAYLDDHTAIELERLLLAEMQATERREKALGANGLWVPGRRPLRFWRGHA